MGAVILGMTGMLAANAAAVLGAFALLRRVRTGIPSVDLILWALLRLVLVSAAVLGAGLLHALRPLWLALGGAAALGVLWARGELRQIPRASAPAWPRWLVAAGGLLLLRLLLQVWFFAPYSGDALSYHLPKIAQWVRTGGFSRLTGGDPRGMLPAGFELVEAWWMVFLHHDALVEMAGVEFLLLGCAAVYAIARRLGWSPAVGLGAAILFGLTPGLHHQATAELNDLAASSLILASAALLVARAHPSLLVMAAGLGIGIKPTYAYAIPGLALLGWLERREPRLPLPGRGVAWALAAGAVGLGAFWYLRNLLWFGNPAYPIGTAELHGPVQQLGPSLASLRDNLRGLVDIRVYDRMSPPGPLLTGNAGWGAATFAAGFPALVLALRESPGLRRLALAFGVALLSIFTLVTYDLWNARFILFVPALGALALARVASAHRWIAGVALAAACLDVVSTCLPAELPASRAARVARMSWRERSARPCAPAADPGMAVGCYGEDFPQAYWLYGPDLSRPVVYLRERTLGALLDRLTRERVESFYVSRRVLYEDRALWDEGVRTRRLEAFRDALGDGFRRLRKPGG